MLDMLGKVSPQISELIKTTRVKYFYSSRAWRKRLQRRADMERDRKNFADAAALYDATLVAQPGNGAIHIQCAHMYKEIGSFQQAETHYLRARLLMPTDPDLHLQLGHFYKVAGRPYEALGAYKQAASLLPSWPEAAAEIEHLSKTLNLQATEKLAPQAAEDVTVTPSVGGPDQPTPDQVTSGQPTPGTYLSVEQIRSSGLFDGRWYLRRYGDVAALGLDPLLHYANDGIKEFRAPGPGFNPHWYRDAYPEAAQAGLDPFTHYILVGRSKNLSPVAPPVYPRWVDAFDSLTDADRAAAEGHIAAAELEGPAVILVIDQSSKIEINVVLQALRTQWLPAKSVTLCLGPNCPVSTKDNVWALAGCDPLFSLAPRAGGAHLKRDWDGPVVLLDATVQLREHALYMFAQAHRPGLQLCYADEDSLGADGRRSNPFFKPDPSPELARRTDYLGRCVMLDGVADFSILVADLTSGATTVPQTARLAFQSAGRGAVKHIPFVLYHSNFGTQPARLTMPTVLFDGVNLPTVSVIIPTRDKFDLLRTCVESLWRLTDYPADRLEVIVADNGSIEQETHDYFDEASQDGKLKVVDADFPFNYSRLNNIAIQQSKAELLVLLNNDTEIQEPDWLRQLAYYAMQPDVGAVGPKLLYEDGTIQHGGVVLSIGGVGAHAHLGLQPNDPGTYGLAQVTHEVAAVTGACLAIRRCVFDEVGMLDEKLPVAFNDLMLCLACLERGYRNLYVGDTWVRHLESKTRGADDTPEKVDTFLREARYARGRFPGLFRADPYYNPNLSLALEEFYEPAFPPRCHYPWRERRRKGRKTPKVMLLSPSFASESELGAIAAAHCQYFASLGYDVTAASPQGAAAVGEQVHYLQIEQADIAATRAVRDDVDCVVIYGWPFLRVARLFGTWPPTALYRHENAEACLISTTGDQRNAQVEYELAIGSFTTVLVPSRADMERVGRRKVSVCVPGADRLGRWSPAVMPLRQQARGMLVHSNQLLVVVGGISPDAAQARSQLDRLTAVAAKLNQATVQLLVINRTANSLPEPRLRIVDRPPSGETASLFAAAEIYLDLAATGRFSLDAVEAGALGARVLTFTGDESDGEAFESMVMRALGETMSADRRNPLMRRSQATEWSDTLSSLKGAIDQLCDHRSDAGGSSLDHLSDRLLVQSSGLFDNAHYVALYSGDATIARDPLGHYLEHGWRTSLRPSPLFYSDWFGARYPEIARSGHDALVHYLRLPAGPYDPNPYFSNETYLARHPKSAKTGLAPLAHYLRHGAINNDSYSGNDFDSVFYRQAHAGLVPEDADPLVHFLRQGKDQGFLAIKPALSAFDPYDTGEIARILGGAITWQAPVASAVKDKWTAARFCINVLSRSASLRARFPHALSEGHSGAFARWISQEGAQDLELSDQALEEIDAVFAADISSEIRQLYLRREDLLSEFPFALTPAQPGDFLAWLHREEIQATGRIRMEQLRWFAIVQAERPEMGLVATYRFKPMLQMLFPKGLTVFGRHKFAGWLRETCGFTGEWTRPETWPQDLTAAEQIRLAYASEPAWRTAHPDAFATHSSARALLDWLCMQHHDVAPDVMDWLHALDLDEVAAELETGGINMLGHFCYPSGLRTSTECLVEGLRRTGARASMRDVWVQPREAQAQRSDYGGLEVYDTTIIHTQPEPFFDTAFYRAGLVPRQPSTYRIGYWYWELDMIPAKWAAQARQVDEIWTATRFVGDALRARFSNPVFEIMPGLELPKFPPLPRSYYGLPEKQFLFLFTFHMASISERKNPLGLISAFKLAFSGVPQVGLILKTSFGDQHPAQLKELHDAAAGSDITIIDQIYTQNEVLGLMQTCDAYVSLHRSEGYGLTMAEAMLLAKPVIATNYSGNLDFMTDDTGLLVDFQLVTLDRAHGPYDVGTRWAEPSVQHAAECMRRVFNNREWARDLGERAQTDLINRMSLESSGKRMAARLAVIKQTRVTSL